MDPRFFHLGVALVRSEFLYSGEALISLMGGQVVLMIFSGSLDSFLEEVVLGGIG